MPIRFGYDYTYKKYRERNNETETQIITLWRTKQQQPWCIYITHCVYVAKKKTIAQSTVSQWHAFNSCQLWRIPSDRTSNLPPRGLRDVGDGCGPLCYMEILLHIPYLSMSIVCAYIYIYIYIHTCIYTYIYDIRRSFTVSVMPRSKTHFTVLQCPVCLMFLNLFSTRVLSNRFENLGCFM